MADEDRNKDEQAQVPAQALSAVEAVAVLAQCRATAEKLVSGGSRAFLDKEDLATLVKFRGVKVAGWADNLEVIGIAGLSLEQVAALVKALNRVAHQQV